MVLWVKFCGYVVICDNNKYRVEPLMWLAFLLVVWLPRIVVLAYFHAFNLRIVRYKSTMLNLK